MDSNILHNWKRIQRCIFPTFEEEYGPQTPAHERIIVILDYLDLARFIPQPGRINGRPPHDRVALANAFVAKASLNLGTTEALIDRLKVDKVLRRLCGFSCLRRLPCKATFSNAFAEFSESDLLSRIHGTLVTKTFSEDLDDKMDSAYDAVEIFEFIKRKGKVAIIEPQNRRNAILNSLCEY
ncbi:MAG: transposase [Oligoflexales bacterium]|nr:transposase [Oligoflexales bacterium]